MAPARLAAMAVMAASACTVAAALAGCASPGEPDGVALGHPVAMRLGEHVVLPAGASLRYLAVRSDSRCPPAVQCIRAGEAEVVFEFSPAFGDPVPVVLDTASRLAAPIGGWQLRLVSLGFGDSPTATVTVTAARPAPR